MPLISVIFTKLHQNLMKTSLDLTPAAMYFQVKSAAPDKLVFKSFKISHKSHKKQNSPVLVDFKSMFFKF